MALLLSCMQVLTVCSYWAEWVLTQRSMEERVTLSPFHLEQLLDIESAILMVHVRLHLHSVCHTCVTICIRLPTV